MLSRENVEQFRELYAQMYGESISHEEAQEKAMRLFDLVWLVYRPLPKKIIQASTN